MRETERKKGNSEHRTLVRFHFFPSTLKKGIDRTLSALFFSPPLSAFFSLLLPEIDEEESHLSVSGAAARKKKEASPSEITKKISSDGRFERPLGRKILPRPRPQRPWRREQQLELEQLQLHCRARAPQAHRRSQPGDRVDLALGYGR